MSLACITEVHVETVGLRGGDRGHGSWAEIRLTDFGNTSMEILVDDESPIELQDGPITLRAEGDHEIIILIAAMEYAAKSLRRMVLENADREPGVSVAHANSMLLIADALRDERCPE
jgi:hypothetical protein